MNTPLQPIEHLFEKIRHLPAYRVAEVEDFVDFLNERTKPHQSTTAKPKEFDFPLISVDKWPEEPRLNREEMYGNDGR